MKAHNLWFGIRNGQTYKPKEISTEADICINNCPHEKCRGICQFYKDEVKKLKENNGNASS